MSNSSAPPAATAEVSAAPGDPNAAPELPPGTRPWAAVWSMLIGFFMLMIDSLIVSVANPTIQEKLNTSLTATIWVTSAYMLAIAVPLLMSGRLGDRFGQKNVFMAGMALFTLASLGCGLSKTIVVLIAMRAAQGVGGALMTPQTQAMIVRMFPPNKRGAPMGLWGAVSGVAMLIAPLLGGFLVDNMGWEAIFLVNVPVGIVGLILAWIFVPRLSVSRPRFDWPGLAISGVGLFLLVFGIQEGSTHDWGRIWGSVTIWELIGAGVVVLAGFVVWQLKGTANPLVPMGLFRHRDFAVASTVVMGMGFVVAAMPMPLLYYLQLARGYSAQSSALFMLPMAVLAGVLSPLVGAKVVHRLGARVISPIGLVVWAAGLCWFMRLATPTQVLVPWALFPPAVIGVGNALIWSPLAVAAMRHLPPKDAGAGASIYNTVRQVGAVLGAACVATLMNARIAANMPKPPLPQVPPELAHKIPTSFANVDLSQFTQVLRTSPALTQWFAGHFSTAMSESMWLPICVAVFAAVVGCGLSWNAGRD
ncbi:MAG: DHA2 family efflux MFS transporter permease subunit [Actinomycetia bacterium]|nr:DHA2 family efflux MFS transporter permease subunit [Actinomycetes bacterium]